MDKNYILGLQKHICEILQTFMSISDIPHYLNNASMSLWVLAYKDESYDLLSKKNNKKMSYYGETIIKSLFGSYLYDNYPDIEESDCTNIMVIKNSKKAQLKYAKKLGMFNYIRYGNSVKDIDEIYIECFRSFFAALEITSNKNKSFSMCMNFFKIIYKDDFTDINVNMSLMMDPKTGVMQILNIINSSNTEKNFMTLDYDERTGIMKLILSDSLISIMKNKGIKINSNILGLSKSFQKDVAERGVYKSAYLYLVNKLNLTIDSVKLEREREYLDSLIDGKKTQIQDKMKSMNIKEIFLKKLEENKGSALIQLWALFNDNTRIPLLSCLSTDKEDNYLSTRKALLDKFINSKFINI